MNKLIFLSLVVIFLCACSGEKKQQSIVGNTMGTYYKVTLYTDENPQELKKDIDKFLELFNMVFSTYIPNSEVSKINTSSYKDLKVTDTMKKLLNLSLEISRKSRGYFDFTVAPLVKAWGFGPDGKMIKKPTNEEIKRLRSIVGYEKIKLDDSVLKRDSTEVKLDFSAVAKGYGVDELVKYLEYKGYGDLIVEIGGEVRARGRKHNGSLWRVGIEGPSEALGNKLVKVVKLNNMSMATSGNYRNYLKLGDEVFGHTIDPKTGMPAKHKLISVSVLSEYCADADAWATAFMAMGAKAGLELANRSNLAALFQVKEGDKIELLTSDAFTKYIKKLKGK